MSAYLIHWTDTGRNTVLHRERPDADAIESTTRVESDRELVGFLLTLPGDGTLTVRAVSEL